MKLTKVKSVILSIWTEKAVSRTFDSDEEFNKHLKGWHDFIDQLEISDIDVAEKRIRQDIISECRGDALSRPSVSSVLQYATVAKNERVARLSRETHSDNRTQEQIAADRERSSKVLSELKRSFK